MLDVLLEQREIDGLDDDETELLDCVLDGTKRMPHKAVYTQPFEQNICITRICSLVRINLAQNIL